MHTKQMHAELLHGDVRISEPACHETNEHLHDCTTMNPFVVALTEDSQQNIDSMDVPLLLGKIMPLIYKP